MTFNMNYEDDFYPMFFIHHVPRDVTVLEVTDEDGDKKIVITDPKSCNKIILSLLLDRTEGE